MLTLLLFAAVAAPDGKTMAADDWHTLAITKVGGEANGPLYLQVQAADLDGDGLPDDAVLKVVCAAGKVTSASYVVTPRDSATGAATGKRQHGAVAVAVFKEWGAASPDLQKIKPQYDVKTLKGNERTADGWTSVTLSNTDGVCAAAQATVIKSKSNIINN